MRIFEGFNLNSKGIYAVFFLLHSSLSEVVWIIYKKELTNMTLLWLTVMHRNIFSCNICRSVYGLWLAYKVKLLTYTKSNRVNWDMISQFSPIVKKQQQMYTNYLCWYLSLKNTILQTIASYKTYIMYAGCSL